jgi:2-polyprenyl-6-hydroxyphenyl methylase/3-demethylubiquinone-9 3-methyltransferase
MVLLILASGERENMPMTTPLRAICPVQASCKCCGAAAPLYGVVDFHKNCESLRQQVLQVSGIPIYYYRCPECRFIFTTAFDHFSKAEFTEHIYNADYAFVDPDYQEVRPRANAVLVADLFAAARPARLLDYGGGNGYLAELLRGAGFPQVDVYDPYVARYAARPAYRYDCLLSFEVVEHSPTPAATFREMADLLTDRGIILFSTLLQPADIDQQGVNWWYIGPRNGHVSLYSEMSLVKVIQPLGFRLASANANLHVLYRQIPDFAKHLIR